MEQPPNPFDPPTALPPVPPPPPPYPDSPPSWLSPTAPMPGEEWPTRDDIDRTLDATAHQPLEQIDHHGRPGRLVSEETFQAVRHHLGRTAVAVAMALPVGVAIFFGWASARAALDDRTYSDSLANSVAHGFFVLVLFVAVATPPMYVWLASGWRAAVTFVQRRAYVRLAVVVFVALPIVAAIVAFVVGHLVAVLIVLFALLLLVVLVGGV